MYECFLEDPYSNDISHIHVRFTHTGVRCESTSTIYCGKLLKHLDLDYLHLHNCIVMWGNSSARRVIQPFTQRANSCAVNAFDHL